MENFDFIAHYAKEADKVFVWVNEAIELAKKDQNIARESNNWTDINCSAVAFCIFRFGQARFVAWLENAYQEIALADFIVDYVAIKGVDDLIIEMEW